MSEIMQWIEYDRYLIKWARVLYSKVTSSSVDMSKQTTSKTFSIQPKTRIQMYFVKTSVHLKDLEQTGGYMQISIWVRGSNTFN